METIYNKYFDSFLISTSPISTTVSSPTTTTTNKFNCSQQTRHLSINLLYLLLANIIIQILCSPGVDSEFVRRDGPYTCPLSGNDVLYCRPGQNEFFKLNDTAIVAWNKDYVIYAGSKTLNVYLFRRDTLNTAISATVPGFPLSVDNDEGSVGFKVSSNWFPSDVTNDNQSTTTTTTANSQSSQEILRNYTFYFRILPEMPPPTFLISSSNDFIAQYYRPSNIINKSLSTSITTTTIVTETNSITESDDHENKISSPVMISVIVISIVAALLAFIVIALSIAVRKSNNKIGKEQNFSTLSASSNTPMVESTLGGNSDVTADFVGSDCFHKGPDYPKEESSIHSTTPLSINNNNVNKANDINRLNTKVSFNDDIINNNNNNDNNNNSSSSSSIVSSTARSYNRSNNNPISVSDAELISDAFRKVLRKPNWKHGDDDTDEEDFDANLSEEDLARRREAKELMKKELAEEGTGIHSVSRRHTTIEHSSIYEGKDDSDNIDNIEGKSSSSSSSSDVGGIISGDSRIININPDNNKLQK